MKGGSKLSQLQVRVSQEEKAAIRRAARLAGMDMSAYVLSRVLPPPAAAFQRAVAALNGPDEPSFALAEINSLISGSGSPAVSGQLPGGNDRGCVQHAHSADTRLDP